MYSASILPGERLHSRSQLWTEKNWDLHRAARGKPDEPAEFSSKIFLFKIEIETNENST